MKGKGKKAMKGILGLSLVIASPVIIICLTVLLIVFAVLLMRYGILLLHPPYLVSFVILIVVIYVLYNHKLIKVKKVK